MGWLWLAFFSGIATLISLDLFVFHRKPGEVPLRAAVGWSIFWISLGVGFSGFVYLVYQNHWMGAVIDRDPRERMSDGSLAVVKYLTAYVLEKSLILSRGSRSMTAPIQWFW